ncbi:MAG: ABC transporter ATP-binding protein [Gammaproteobacteria bacterium]
MLSIHQLSKTYSNGVRALDNVTLEIPVGMFGLLGPNGAGKSSLMRTIATLQKPDAGSIVFGEIDVLRQPDEMRKTLGYLPQDFGVYPRISALDMLDHMAVLKGILKRGERRELVDQLLHRTNLYDARKKALKSYSGGMRQRFGIAQALLGDPSLIIVDEPTAGLDPEERNRFLNVLSDVGENKVVILSTHIVEDVADLCPRMAILAGGRIILEGSPTHLMNELEGRVWRKTVERSEVERYRAEHTVISAHLNAGKSVLHVLCDTSPGEGFESATADLEDVYFSIISDGQQRDAA